MSPGEASATGPAAGRATWLITGATGGFGRVLAERVLARGDAVVLAARRPEQLDDLAQRYPDTAMTVALDLTSTGGVAALVEDVERRFGSLDVLVNNAGYGLLAAIEEAAPDEYRPLFEVNLFGPIELIRAALPALRRSRKARIVNLSSVGGFVATAGFGYYNATKFALEGLSDALALELAPHGIDVILVQPGAFRTNVIASLTSARHRLAEYDETVGPSRRYRAEAGGTQAGDPAKGAALVVEAVDSERPPRRLPLGADACARIEGQLATIARDLDAWRERAAKTSFADARPAPQWATR